MADFNVWSYLAKLRVQVRGPNDPFFEDGDHLCKVNSPVSVTVEDVEEFLHKEYQEFSCQVPGCQERFKQLYQCEQHYNAAHKHSCSVCKKSLPSNHLLELHLQENHDSFFSVLAEKKPSFQCFLPTCDVKFWGPEERRDHAISSHYFPPDFRFDQIKKKPRKKNSKTKETVRNGTGDSMEVEEKNGAEEKKIGNKMENDIQNKIENKMEIDGEEVILRRSSAAKRPISLARMGERVSVVESPISPNPLPAPFPSTSDSSPHLPFPTLPATPPQTQEFSGLSLAKLGFHGNLEARRESLNTNRESVYLGSRESVSQSPRESAKSPQDSIGSSRTRSRASREHENHLGNGNGNSSPRNNKSRPASVQDSENSPCSSPRKSKIPVRSNSCRAPKTFSFGAGVPRGFLRPKEKHWFQSTQSINTVSDIQTSDFSALKGALPS
ncbi:uncharacterized protein LOC111697435 [Eurytemora carolleeae]|uniref:uncharacterized protein LOC111697435 n=1 Tax=Eurytemora carolleeae TaxID=1294199 RepID=UPI000C755D87|nr:uncharacterized protein LOC111697435 [Eurytemora carolleeae]|eukprot:XP_023323226.1 uncharacterized protein LOC111697435 [Eurytemora affinis]